MTGAGVEPSEPNAASFDELITTVMASASRFGHREHVELTWLAVHRFGVPAAIDLISDGIRRTTRYAGAPQKYHATVSRAWVELVGHHVVAGGAADRADRADLGGLADGADRADRADLADLAGFADFAEHNPDLLDKRLLTHFYRPSTLADPEARVGWVEPDLNPFPWRDARR